MFNPHKPIILPEECVWDRVTRGELINLTIDLETSGMNRAQVPYATPGAPFITDIGICRSDLCGNFESTWQIFPKKPDNMAFDPAATLVSRVQDMGPELFDDEGRTPYWQAMAAFAWYIENSAYAYDEMAKHMGLKKVDIGFTDFNSAFKQGSKAGADSVYEIPLLGKDGQITHNVRYHPDRRKISYRFDRRDLDGNNAKYRGFSNQYYIDQKDGSAWKWVEPGVSIDGYNFNRYDLPIIRANLNRVGFSPANTTFLYARGTPTSRQRPRNHLTDVRDLTHMHMLYGAKGEDGIQLGEVVDFLDGPRRPSEALGAYLEKLTGQANPLRMLRGGPFDPRDGSFFDKPLAHGAVYDAVLTRALSNLCWQRDPYLSAKLDRQADKNQLMAELTRQSPDGSQLPFFSLPTREGGVDHSDLPYIFVGTDDQIGRFNEVIFMRADGVLHQEKFRGKMLKDLDVEDWVDYLRTQQEDHKPGRAVRIEPVRRKPEILDVNFVLQHTAQGDRYAGMIPAMIEDGKYFAENPHMRERLINALSILNHERRFDRKFPHNPYLEDSLPGHYAGKVYFQEEAIEIERRMIWERSGRQAGAQRLPGVLESINAHMNNDFLHMRSIDEGIQQLCLTAHMIDWYKDHDLEDDLNTEPTAEGRFAAQVLENFSELCERLHKKFKAKEYPYLAVLDDIINPATGEPFFKGHKFMAETPAQAFYFREALGRRALEDMDKLLRYKTLPPKLEAYIDERGMVDQDFDKQTLRGRPLLLFADPDNGEINGGKPHVCDESGGIVDVAILKGLNAQIDYDSRSNQNMRDHLDKLVSTKQWSMRFYQDRSQPSLHRLLYRFVDLGRTDQIPESVFELYKADFENRMKGMENETALTDRMATLRSMEHEIRRLEIASSSGDSHLLERDPDPNFTAAAKALKYEEGQQRLVYIRAWIEKMKSRLTEYDTGYVRRTDVASGLPLDHIRHTVRRNSAKSFEQDDGFVCLDVPHAQIAFAMENHNPFFPTRGIVIPEPSAEFRKAVARRKPVLLRSLKSGQIYATGPSHLVKLPGRADDAALTVMRGQAIAYDQAGILIDPQKSLWFLGLEKPYPLANTRSVDFSHQALKLPRLPFEGLTMPEYAALGKTPITAAVLPMEYYPTRVEKGKPIRLKEMCAEMFDGLKGETDAPETGHVYTTTLVDAFGLDESGKKVGIRLRDLLAKIRSGEIPPAVVEGMGFLGPDHLQAQMNRWATEKWKAHPLDQPMIVTVWDRVNRDYQDSGRVQEFNTWAFCPQDRAPDAAFSWDGEPVLPTMYKDLTQPSSEH